MSEFEELYNSYYKDVYYFVLKPTGYQEHITEEVTQESFLEEELSCIVMKSRDNVGFGYR